MIDHRPHLLPKVRSCALLDGVRGFPCTIRIASFVPGLKCASSETVVACHMPGHGRGTGTKVSDLHIAAGCSVCHDLLDRRNPKMEWLMANYPSAVMVQLLNAMSETQAMLVRDGLIVIPKSEMI